MAEMTLDQQRAIAIANARMRAAQGDTASAAVKDNPSADLAPPSVETPAKDVAWSDVPGQAAANIVPSAKRFGGDLVSAISDPIGTVKNIGRVGLGTVEKLIPGDQEHEKYADAVGRFFSDRYGGMENVKRTMATDPVGFLADLSTLLTGGAGAAARLPGTAGRVAAATGTVASKLDPIQGAVKATSMLAKGAGNVGAGILGVTTGAGRLPFVNAAKAGFEGGAAGQAFRENMRGNVSKADVIGDVNTGLNNIKAEREAAYNAGMTGVRADNTILDFSKVEQAIDKTRGVGTFTGKNSGITVSTNESTASTMAKIDALITKWKALPPDDFYTPAGFDALKKSLGDIVDSTEFGTPAHKVATSAYNAVKSEIAKQAPEYAKTMAGYTEASELIRDIEKTLSTRPGVSVDTELRKLQSVMRDGVQTNYGHRVKLVELLQENGATNILAKLAGQSLSSLEPRGMARVGAGLEGAGLFGLVMHDPGWLIPAAGSLAMSSPRLTGEVVHGGARAAGLVGPRLTEALRSGYAVRGADQEKTRP